MVKLKLFLLFSALLVGLLYITPPLIVASHLAKIDSPFVLNFEIYRDELFYLARAREVYDGYFPPTDPYFDEQLPTIQNPLPSLILAGFIAVTGGNINAAYLLAQFVFAPLIFILFYWLGRLLFDSRIWTIFFAYAGVLTPIALRILNFHGA